jgi:hypothetical protein
MTTEIYIHCVVASLLGVVFHIAVKIKSLHDDHKVANLKFSVAQYLKDDWIALVVDVLAALILVYLVSEWVSEDSRILTKMKSIFVFVGYTGSSVLMQVLSVAKKNFRKAVDYKTNIADASTGTLDNPTPTK